VSFFPPELQDSVLYRIGDAIYWVLSQRLIKTPDWSGRVGIFEVLIGTPWIRNLIKGGDLNQIDAQLEMWSQEGMIQMYKYAKSLEKKWIIHEKDYIHYFKDEI
jgi:twitching motility protein PilT